MLMITVFTITDSQGQRLERFASVTSGLSRNGKPAGIAYPATIRYFGYFPSGDDTLKILSTDSSLSVYFRLSGDVSELGLRVFSPVPGLVFPDRGDEVPDYYYLFEKDKGHFFKPVLRLYKAEPDPASPGHSVTAWKVITPPANSQERPTQTDGRNNQTVIRWYDKKNPSNKIIQEGLYKIELLQDDTLLQPGTFIIDVGCITEIQVLKWVH